ncbi:MAG: ABC transporter permease [Firmicutes bacterium]|nr:ABC transporter permease [Bacillota bacterium]
MIKKSRNTNKIAPVIAILLLLLVWQVVSGLNIVPSYMLPSPLEVVGAFIEDFSLLMYHAGISLAEAFVGLGIAVAFSFVLAFLMERFSPLYHAFYPLLVITQTIPAVAIAPLLVLWFGYDMAPKIVLIFLVTFFPIVVGLLDGFRTADEDAVRLLKTMGASHRQIFFQVRLPASLPHFFSGLRIAVAYSVVGAVIAEWLGGFGGLGVYMTRVKNAYAFDEMFAVIFLITIVSLLLIYGVRLLQYVMMPWDRKVKEERKES